MSLAHKVAVNTLVQIGSKAVTVLFGLATTYLLTNYLGREGYGDYMYVLTLVILFGALADWGTQTIGVREAAKSPSGQGRVFGNILLLRLILSLVAAILVLVSSSLLPLKTARPDLLRQGIALGSLIVILFATKASLGVIFQTKLKMARFALADIIASLSTLLVTWHFIQIQAGLIPLLGAVILANVLALLIALVMAGKTVRFDFRPDRVFLKKLVIESLPMGAVLLLFTVDNKVDTVMLGLIQGSGAVGIYSVAYRMYDVLILGAAYLMNSLLPVFSRQLAGEGSRPQLTRTYQKAFDALLFMGFGVLVFVCLFAPVMVRLVTGQSFPQFTAAVPVLRILSLALFFAYFNHLVGYTLVAAGHQRPYFWISLSALIFNVGLNIFAIRHFSFYGAATVTVLTEAAILVLAVWMIKTKLKIQLSFKMTLNNLTDISRQLTTLIKPSRDT